MAIAGSSLIGLKQPSRSLPARSSDGSMTPAHWSDNSSAPKSTLFPTSKIKLLPCACIQWPPRLITKSFATSVKI